jgi:superfamily II DNA/RNA helicase
VDERTPLVVTFEEMARGLHFDAVDAVFIVGIPDSPSTYLHLAGRTGRQPVLQGTVVTLCPGAAHENLLGWSTRLGGIEFEELEVGGEAAEE